MSVNPYSKPESQAQSEESETLCSLSSVQGAWHSSLPETVMVSWVISGQSHASVPETL